MDKPKVDGVHGFQDSEREHTSIAENIRSHIEKLRQNNATKQDSHENQPRIVNYPPPGGRIAWQGASPSAVGSGIQHSREGDRTFTGNEVHGKVEVSGNHPNKKLSHHYG